MATIVGGYLAIQAKRNQKSRETRMALVVRNTLVAILRRGSIVDTDNLDEIDAAMVEQEKIAARIEKTT